MSEIPNSAEQANTGLAGEHSSQVGQQSVNTAQQHTQYMFWSDPVTQQWSIHPFYINIFENQLNIIEALFEVVNQKWSEQEVKAYLAFL